MQQIVGKSGKYGNSVTMWDGQIDSVCDIEENMWSPWLGVKGKVDFTVKVVNSLFFFFIIKCVVNYKQKKKCSNLVNR
jgi:hypothetical protein